MGCEHDIAALARSVAVARHVNVQLGIAEGSFDVEEWPRQSDRTHCLCGNYLPEEGDPRADPKAKGVSPIVGATASKLASSLIADFPEG